MDESKICLTEVINTLEEERKKTIKKIRKRSLIVILILIAITSYFFIFSRTLGAIYVLFVLAMLTPFILLIIRGILYKKWRYDFKHLFLKNILENYFMSFKYEPQSFIKPEEYRKSLLFIDLPGFDRYYGEDLIEGSIDKVQIRLSEIHTDFLERHEKKNRELEMLFHGLFIICDFNKNFHGITIVLPDIEAMLGKAGSILQKSTDAIRSLPGEPVKLEDPEFEKNFRVYSTDQIEARYILSPSLMERILNYRKKIGQAIRLSFVESKLFVAVPLEKKFLEPPSFYKPLDVENIKSLINQYLSDFEFATSVVKELNLNTRIWT